MAISPRGSDSSAKKTTKEIREWAIWAGREVSLRGRISAEIEQAFYDAQSKKVQGKTAPVKKTAATKTAVKKPVAATTPGKRVKPATASTPPATKTAAKKTPEKKKATTKSVAEKTAVKMPVAAKVPAAGEVVSKASAKKSSREIREWALGVGHEVSSRGRIPAEIQQAFHEAQAKQVRPKAAPVKKVAAKKAAVRKTAQAKKAQAVSAPATKTAAKKTAVKKAVAAKVPAAREVVSKAPAGKSSSREIREWALGVGHEVSSRGRIPAEIQQAFHDAQAKQVQATAATVKKTAGKKTAATVPVKPATASTAPTTKTAAKKTAATKTREKKRGGEKSAGKKPVAAKVPAAREVVSKAPAGKSSSREIREWALGAGHEVSSRGRIPSEIQRAFRDAQVKMPVA
ncbi:histone-like nucleoid-structuring protein Lsr2 [Rhodococcus jostii]